MISSYTRERRQDVGPIKKLGNKEKGMRRTPTHDPEIREREMIIKKN